MVRNMADIQLTLANIFSARNRIAGRVRRTPLVHSHALTSRAGVPVHLKCEHHQETGSFKLRGATNAISALADDQRACGIVAVSTGNHGRGVARAARLAGARAIVCMSELVPQVKIDAIEREGGEVRIIGSSQDDADEEARRLVRDEGLTMIPPFDHPDVIAGQGTLGLEIFEDFPELETAIIPLSGGGLMAGVALALKSLKPGVRIVGATMARGAGMYECLQAGKPIFVAELETLADSLGGGIGLENAYTFAMCRQLVDEIVLLSEGEIAEGIRHLYFEEREIVEGGGAVAPAALIAGKVAPGGPTLCLLSGRNIDMALHGRIIAGDFPDTAAQAE